MVFNRLHQKKVYFNPENYSLFDDYFLLSKALSKPENNTIAFKY